MPRAIFLRVLVALYFFALIATAQTTSKSEGLVKDKYHSIQIEPFEVQQGVELPAEFLATLPPHVVQQLKDSHKFQEVLAPGDKPSQPDAPVLRLTGKVTGYDEGSRGKRYLAGGFGAGNARLFLTLKYLDRDSGQIVYQEKVVGTLAGGLFGGGENKVVDEVARSVTATTKLVLLRKLGDPLNVVEEPSASSGAPADRQAFEIKSGEIPAAEQKMNELASAGYRVTDIRTTGAKSADITMDKTATPPQTYQYALPHALFIGNVQKNMNKLGAEGYRIVPHSVIFLGGYFAIMEKPVVPSGSKYEYRLSISLQQSNAEKHVAEDQQKGFALVEAEQLREQKVVVSEKVTAPEQAER
jgi:Domain of unknown function (DUF4410)